MWLPTPIYERVPQFWLLLGLLFMASGTYLGFEYALSFVYFGVGAFCVAWSFGIFAMRTKHRRRRGGPIRGVDFIPVDDKTQPLHEQDIARLAARHAAAVTRRDQNG